MPGNAAGRLRRGAAGGLTSVAPDVDDIALVIDDDADIVALVIGARDDPDAATMLDVLDIDQASAARDADGLVPGDAVVFVVVIIGRRTRRWRGDLRRGSRNGDRRRNNPRRRANAAAQRLGKRRRGRNQAETGGQDETTGQHGRAP